MDQVKNFDGLLGYFPPALARLLAELPREIRERTREVRLRVGKAPMLFGAYGLCFPAPHGRYSCLSDEKSPVVGASDIEYTVAALCGKSIYSHRDEINAGYISFGGGCRAGVCGTAVLESGQIRSVRDIASVTLRLARNVDGAAQTAAEQIFSGGAVNAVVFGPPMCGKTTFLKDLARILSSAPRFYRVVLADERFELGAAEGVNLDIFSGYPKAEAVERAVRTFAPEFIVCDEIGTVEECDAVLRGMDSGVRFVLSVHAGGADELLRRPLCRRLIACGSFEKFIFLPAVGEKAQIYDGRELYEQMHCRSAHPDIRSAHGDLLELVSEQTDIGA